jgi:acetylglutamate kinase
MSGGAGAKARRIVIKFGGEVVEGVELGHLCDDVRELSAAGHKVALVHGGGRQMTELSEKLGIATRIIAGRRVTDEPTLQVLKMVVAGRLAVDLCAALGARGVKAVALNGASGMAVRAVKRPPKVLTGAEAEGPVDLGFVGDVTGFNLELVELLWSGGYVPAVGCIGADPAGQVYNINADVVAGDLAAALRADQLLLVSTVPGVLADAKDPSTRLPRLSRADGQRAIADGTVKGGMIPKLEEAFGALSRGVGEVHILGKLGPGDLRRASDEPGAVGTALLP